MILDTAAVFETRDGTKMSAGGNWDETIGREKGVHTSWPLCGWSGNPAPGFTEKWSSIRKGEKFLSCGVPMDLLTRAPAPSACSTARKALRIARGALEFAAGAGCS